MGAGVEEGQRAAGVVEAVEEAEKEALRMREGMNAFIKRPSRSWMMP